MRERELEIEVLMKGNDGEKAAAPTRLTSPARMVSRVPQTDKRNTIVRLGLASVHNPLHAPGNAGKQRAAKPSAALLNIFAISSASFLTFPMIQFILLS